MWSDNKKNKAEVDDCRCSGSSGDSVGAAANAAVASATVQPPQQLNVFTDNNSKKQSSTFGANLTEGKKEEGGSEETTSQKKNKEVDNSSAHTIDSGFISGPQTSSSIFEDEEASSSAATSSSTSTSAVSSKYNIQHTKSQSSANQQKTLTSCSSVLDSGCIDEPLDEDEAIDDDNEASSGVATTQSTTQQARNNKQQLSNITNTSSSSSTSAASSDDKMILKQNVDGGMSEWFCNLSLQNNQPTAQQQPQVVAGLGMNNLDASDQGRRLTPSISTTTPTSFNAHHLSNRQQQQQAAGNSAFNTNTNTSSSSAITHPWEQFYQQNDDGDTHLHLACISGYVDVVAALIRMAPHPCLFNIQNDEAQTPLHLAVLTVQPKILRMLLIAGAEPTIRDRHGNTALHLACNAGEEQCVRALTIPISASEIHEAHRLYGHRSNDKTVSYLNCAQLPSDLEIRNYDGERCVHLAAQAGHIDILRILVLYGADINAREGKSGRTPLHIAIEACNEDLANFLLDECQKLNLETATYAGLTAYQVACVLNKSQMQNMLEKRGAEPLTPPDSDYDDDFDYDIEDLEESKLYDRFGDPGYFTSYGGNPMTVA